MDAEFKQTDALLVEEKVWRLWIELHSLFIFLLSGKKAYGICFGLVLLLNRCYCFAPVKNFGIFDKIIVVGRQGIKTVSVTVSSIFIPTTKNVRFCSQKTLTINVSRKSKNRIFQHCFLSLRKTNRPLQKMVHKFPQGFASFVCWTKKSDCDWKALCCLKQRVITTRDRTYLKRVHNFGWIIRTCQDCCRILNRNIFFRALG